MDFKIDMDLSGIKKLERGIRSVKKRHIKTGWYEGKGYPASHRSGGITYAQVAAWQEWGYGKIPARPYFTQAINKIKYGYKSEVSTVFLDAIKGNDTTSSLNSLANQFTKEYNFSVLKQNYTPLAEYTIRLKGHSFQMLDSGRMMNNYKSKVYRTSHLNIKNT